MALVAVQVTLGAMTVLTQRNEWINSLHVVCGALVLATSLVLTLRRWRIRFALDRHHRRFEARRQPPWTASASNQGTPSPTGARA